MNANAGELGKEETNFAPSGEDLLIRISDLLGPASVSAAARRSPWRGALPMTKHARRRYALFFAPDVPEELKPAALQLAGDIADDRARSRALSGLAPYLAESLKHRALESARGIGDDFLRSGVLSGFAHELSSDSLKRQALDITCEMKDESARASTLANLTPHLSAQQQGKALDALASVKNEASRAEVLRPVFRTPARSAPATADA
jgi:hypothetical protein